MINASTANFEKFVTAPITDSAIFNSFRETATVESVDWEYETEILKDISKGKGILNFVKTGELGNVTFTLKSGEKTIIVKVLTAIYVNDDSWNAVFFDDDFEVDYL